MKKPVVCIIFCLILLSCEKPIKKKEKFVPLRQKLTFHDMYYKKHPAVKGWRSIIIHHSATGSGKASVFHKWHYDKGWGGLAYHIVIGNGRGMRDGEIHYGYRWLQQISGNHVTVGAYYHSLFGIGICLVGNFDYSRPTGKQLAALIRLIKKFSKKYGIKKENIYGHKDTPHGKMYIKGNRVKFVHNAKTDSYTTCPGKYFPMKYVLKMAFKKKIVQKKNILKRRVSK